MNDKEELIVEIFKNMNFGCKSATGSNSGDGSLDSAAPADLIEFQKNIPPPVKSFSNALEAAKKAETKWKTFSAVSKSNSLHKVWRALVDKSNVPSSLKHDFSILINYFEFYSDLAVQVDKIPGKPNDVVVVVLPPDPCFLIFGATVPAALAAGCSVIVQTEQPIIPLFLTDVIKQAGLPDGIFNVLTGPLPDHLPLKTIYCGSLSVTHNDPSRFIKFFSPNNTAALVLESCDLNSAVAEIFCKTWESDSIWGVSTVVVQESIIEKFLDVLKFHMDNFSNKNRLKFKNEEILERINNAIIEAVKAGGVVVKSVCNENEWGPTALVDYQNQEENLPVLKVLVCRTAKEGGKLLNNFHAFGTSIWSECSAQALETASQLESLNVWINCHGIADAQVPVSVTGANGNFVFGGRQGLLEYFSPGALDLKISEKDSDAVSRKPEVLETLLSAKKAFDSWRSNKNKRKCFKSLATSLENTKEFSEHAQILNHLTSLANCPKLPEKTSTDEFFVAYQETPIGVISLFISSEIDGKTLLTLIGLPIALGIAMVLVTEEENPLATCLVDLFNKNFPKNLLSKVYRRDAGLILDCDPTVQAFWVYEKAFTELGNQLSKCLKHTWIFPKDVTDCEELILTQCVRRKITWLPKVEKFP